MTTQQMRIKRVIDVAASLFLLTLLMPVCVVATFWILLDDGRPVLFVATRAGRGGRRFQMLKFRTMLRGTGDAREMGIADDPFSVLKDDPRVTRSGRFLRRTSLDELPQLLNVLRGEMSLVGPRPDVVEQVERYTRQDLRRLEVLPGMTGLAQVSGRDEIGWPERIAADVWYIDHWSLWLDARIMLRTLAQFFRREPDPIEDRMNIERLRRQNPDCRTTEDS